MKTTTASRDPAAFHRLQELVRDIDVAMMTTVTPDGALHSRPMVTLEFRDQGEVWFATSDESTETDDIEAEHAVNLSYADPNKGYVSITGNAAIVRDAERARELWNDRLERFFPGGPGDPHLALVAVYIETAEYWKAPGAPRSRVLGEKRREGNRAAHDGDGQGEEHAKIDVRRTPSSG